MSYKLFGRITLLAAMFASASVWGAEKFPEEMAVMRAKASVFKVFARGEFTLSNPRDIQFTVPDGKALTAGLDAAYDRDLKSGAITDKKSRSDYYWEKLAEAPDKYLTASSVQETRKLTDREYGSGSCFAISCEGIFLTNAHVVADPNTEDIFKNDGIAFKFFGEPLLEFLGRATKTFGAEPSSPEFSLNILNRVLKWWKPKCKAGGKFQGASIALAYRDEQLEKVIMRNGWQMTIDHSKELHPRAEVMYVNVLAVGSVWPGEDVAVLEAVYNLPSHLYPLICLPLGDSDIVLSGMRVHALGFPSISFEKHIMDAKAEFQCSCVDGAISNRKAMLGGMEAFETTLGINHGDSGGPQIDNGGNVIAINVAGADDHGNVANAHSFAIPINIAKKYLKRERNGVRDTITLDPGPLTRLWADGLTFYAGGRYAEAKREFDELSTRSNAGFLGRKEIRTNPYVNDMIALCEKHLQKSSGQDVIAPKKPADRPKEPFNRRGATPEDLSRPFDFGIPRVK